MKTRSLALSIILVSGMAATAAVAAYSTATPAAVATIDRPVQPLPETRTIDASTGNRLSSPNSQESACQQAVWPYIPGHCMKNVDPERVRKPVRIIRIDASLPKAAIRGRQ